MINYAAGSLALAHNGNLVNAKTIRKELGSKGAIFQSTNDSEVIVHLMAQAKSENFVDRAAEALRQVSGAYSLVLMTENELLAARDPHGFRPLCLGKLDGAYIIASETCVMDLIEAEFIREVEPGELILINENGLPVQKVRVTLSPFTGQFAVASHTLWEPLPSWSLCSPTEPVAPRHFAMLRPRCGCSSRGR